jgi:hypothetical protein
MDPPTESSPLVEINEISGSYPGMLNAQVMIMNDEVVRVLVGILFTPILLSYNIMNSFVCEKRRERREQRRRERWEKNGGGERRERAQRREHFSSFSYKFPV